MSLLNHAKAIFGDADQKLYLYGAGLGNIMAGLVSWLGANWLVVAGFVVGSLVPAYMAIRKQNAELKHLKRMNDLAYEKARLDLEQARNELEEEANKPVPKANGAH